MPPPSVKPATPVVEMRPPVDARPNACASASKSFQSRPGCTTARRAAGSTRTPRMPDRSMTIPPSTVEKPGIECAPERTAISSPSLRAVVTARATSAAPAHLTITAGRVVSNMPFQIGAASS